MASVPWHDHIVRDGKLAGETRPQREGYTNLPATLKLDDATLEALKNRNPEGTTADKLSNDWVMWSVFLAKNLGSIDNADRRTTAEHEVRIHSVIDFLSNLFTLRSLLKPQYLFLMGNVSGTTLGVLRPFPLLWRGDHPFKYLRPNLLLSSHFARLPRNGTTAPVTN
jgi:hypothetical protein